MRYALIDCRMSEKCRSSLENMGLKIVSLPINDNLDMPVSAHPDISVFAHKNRIVAESKCFPIISEHLFHTRGSVHEITEGHTFAPNTKYPYDCVLNFAVCGNNLIGNMKHINPAVADIAKIEQMTLIDVKQGYAKCNICVVSENSLITEDKGIASACKNYGIDVLFLEPGTVKLEGYKNGFIGGASGMLSDVNVNKILFCGCIERHPEFDLIKSFCEAHGAVPVSLSDEDLYDYGSIIIL